MTKTEAVIRSIFGAVGMDLRPLVYAVDAAIELLFLQGVAMDDICVTKDIYPETARRFGTTGPGVERAVRTLIHAVWRGEDHHMLEQIAGTHLTQPPTNAEFIDMLAGFLRQCELCDEEAEE